MSTHFFGDFAGERDCVEFSYPSPLSNQSIIWFWSPQIRPRRPIVLTLFFPSREVSRLIASSILFYSSKPLVNQDVRPICLIIKRLSVSISLHKKSICYLCLSPARPSLSLVFPILIPTSHLLFWSELSSLRPLIYKNNTRSALL